MEPAISVLFLSCNRTRYVREALDGLRQQEYRDWALVASDCSNKPEARDEIHAMLQQFRDQHPNNVIKIIQQPEIVPEGENLRRALAAAETPFVALLHDDDVWMPNHLRRSLTWLEQSPRHGLTISNGRVIDGQSQVLGWTNSREVRLPQPGDRAGWLRLVLTSFHGAASGYILRREALARHQFYPVAVVDIDVAVTVLLDDYEVLGFPEASFYYRVHQGSNYEKGAQVVRDRHRWRLWLFRRQGLRIIMKFPRFFFLVIKSALAIVSDTFRGKGQAKSQIQEENAPYERKN